jgi:SAM-dependent methyltransferase
MTPYSREFYKHLSEPAVRAAAEVLPLVFEYIQPRSVVDVGCGTGEWLAAFRAHGISDLLGVDGPWVDPDLLSIPREQFRVLELTSPVRLDQRFDLVVSLEVAEHLPPEAAETFVESLTRLGGVVLFSAAVPYQGGTNHLNERWPTYWAGLFRRCGFRAIDCLRPRLWRNLDVELCYVQNMMFFAGTQDLDTWPKLAQVAKQSPEEPLDLVHPRLYLQSTAFAKYPKELLHGTLGSIRDKWLIPSRRKAALDRRKLGRWPGTS